MIFNKKFKLKSYFTERIPLCIRRRIYYQTQIEVARADGYCHKTYSKVKYKTDEYNIKEIGMIAHNLLKEFEETGDLSIAEYEQLVGMDIDRNESVLKDKRCLSEILWC